MYGWREGFYCVSEGDYSQMHSSAKESTKHGQESGLGHETKVREEREGRETVRREAQEDQEPAVIQETTRLESQAM